MWKTLSFENLGSFRFDLRPGGARAEEAGNPPKIRAFQTRDIRIRAELLLCTLIDNLRFTYDITEEDFSAIMVPACPALYERAVTGVTRLLKLQEQDEVLEIASAVADACIRVANNHQSLITMQDRAYIIANVIEPARHLRIEPQYMIEQLHDLNVHQWHATNLKETFLYANTTSRWGRALCFLSSGRKQTFLAKRLVSDDITITNLNAEIGDHLRTMLGTAIAEFDKRRCGSSMGSVDREIYVDLVAVRLAREAENRENMARRERNAKHFSAMPTHARLHRLDEDVPPVPSLPNTLPKIRANQFTTSPVLSTGPELKGRRAKADNVALGVRTDDEEPQSLLVEYRPDVQAPALRYRRRSQSSQDLRRHGNPRLQRSISMTVPSVPEIGRGW